LGKDLICKLEWLGDLMDGLESVTVVRARWWVVREPKFAQAGLLSFIITTSTGYFLSNGAKSRPEMSEQGE
jgi:hypothetical protein